LTNRYGAGRSGVRLQAAGSYQDLVYWYCIAFLPNAWCAQGLREPIQNAKQTNYIDTRPCKHSDVTLQEY